VYARGDRMRELERIDRVIEKVRKLWHKFPDQRLGQLMENYAFEHHMDYRVEGKMIIDEAVSCCNFHQEDDKTEENIDEWLRRLKNGK